MVFGVVFVVVVLFVVVFFVGGEEVVEGDDGVVGVEFCYLVVGCGCG